MALKALEDASARRLLECLFGNSPYLGELACRDQVSTLELLIEGPAAAVESAYRDHLFNPVMAETEADISRRLRRAKRRVALALAVADITCHWDLDKVTYELSSLADRAVGIAGGHLLQQLHDRGKITLPDAESDPWSGSGLIVLGMGKLGAFELNYSSDIDLIILFDADRITTPDSDELQTHMSRLARGLGRLLGERTSEGYVFRTDLRLRPDPNSTPPALSVLAAETYYESIGQNWERAAMIKARAIAADQPAATAFLRHLRPFVWRKSLDFHAIRDVQSIKRQIHAHKGGGEVRLAGHNIKLGRGGIREIEFFAQTQQLIWGGRETRLRERATQPALIGLSDVGYLDRGVAVELIEDYRFLRTLEHRLQMIHDEQTQTLPDDEEGLRHLSVFMGFDSLEAFA
ncbi:MAG: glutamine-synthetase adenylyltransferase, partial [Rhodospirillales bacterium]